MGRAMIGISSDLERNLFTVANTAFNQSYDKAVGDYQAWKSISTVIPSNTTTHTYPFFAPIGNMEKWVDERQREVLEAMNVTLTNIDWEKTVEIKRSEIEDDQLGMAMLRVRTLGEIGAMKAEQEVAALLNTHMGDTTDTDYPAGFDSQALFSISHAWPAGYTTSQDNLRGSAAANEGVLNLVYGEKNIQGAFEDMAGFKNSKERLIGGKPDTLMVSMSTFFAARKLLESVGLNIAQAGTTDVTAYERPNKNILPSLGLNVVLNPELTSGYWLAADTRHSMKPVLFQDRQDVRFESQTTSASDDVFNRGMYAYGISRRFAVAPGYWFYVVGGDGT